MGQGQPLGLIPAADYPADRLYRIETNRDFAWLPELLQGELRDAAIAFGLPVESRVDRVRKNNPVSSIYRARTATRGVILRGCPLALDATTGAQCRILDAVAYPRIVKPLQAASGGHTVRTDSLVWMAYEEQPGELFPGSAGAADAAVVEVLALQAALSTLQSVPAWAPDLAALPRAQHRPERWVTFMTELATGRLLETLPPATLGPDTATLLGQNQAFLAETTALVAALPVAGDVGLTHNDLHHANVLVDGGRYFFLDVEDICFESRRVALAHAAFKLGRHMVYAGAASRSRARAEIMPAVCRATAAAGLTPIDLFAYGAFRIISDIFEIVAYTIERGDTSQLYDLEKRVHNLFELHDLLGGNHGPAAS